MRCSYAHCSWLLQDGNREKTNTLWLSLESSSKFSISLSCTSLLQREAPLMAPFHTWISRAHYSTGGGGHRLISNSAHENFFLSHKAVHKEMPLIRLIIVLVLYILPLFSFTNPFQKSASTWKANVKILPTRARTRTHAQSHQCKRLQLLQMKIGFL